MRVEKRVAPYEAHIAGHEAKALTGFISTLILLLISHLKPLMVRVSFPYSAETSRIMETL